MTETFVTERYHVFIMSNFLVAGFVLVWFLMGGGIKWVI